MQHDRFHIYNWLIRQEERGLRKWRGTPLLWQSTLGTKNQKKGEDASHSSSEFWRITKSKDSYDAFLPEIGLAVKVTACQNLHRPGIEPTTRAEDGLWNHPLRCREYCERWANLELYIWITFFGVLVRSIRFVLTNDCDSWTKISKTTFFSWHQTERNRLGNVFCKISLNVVTDYSTIKNRRAKNLCWAILPTKFFPVQTKIVELLSANPSTRL